MFALGGGEGTAAHGYLAKIALADLAQLAADLRKWLHSDLSPELRLCEGLDRISKASWQGIERWAARARYRDTERNEMEITDLPLIIGSRVLRNI
jgi:hypothetical protein